MFSRIKELILTHIRNYSKRYFFLLIAFIIGVSAGAFTVNGLSSLQNEELGNYFQGFLKLFDNQQVKSGELLQIAALENLKLVLALWILGVSIIGIPFIFVLISVRGFITGFCTGFIIKAMGINGVLFVLCSILPKEIIIIPCLIALGVNGVNFSLNIIRNRSARQLSKEGLKSTLFSYCFVTLFYSVFIFFGILIETYIVPVLMRLIAPVIS